MKLFNKFPDNSRLWLYQSNRMLTPSEIKEINNQIEGFVQKWAAHGNKLWADAAILNPYFIAFVVDDALTPPSGCSIDASVHFLKELGKQFNIDFFTRTKVCLLNEDNKIDQIDFDKLKELNLKGNELLFDPLISNLKDLREEWPLEINKSSFAMVLS